MARLLRSEGGKEKEGRRERFASTVESPVPDVGVQGRATRRRQRRREREGGEREREKRRGGKRSTHSGYEGL